MQAISLLDANVAHRLARCLLIVSLLIGAAAQAEERLMHGVTQAKDGVQIHYESGGRGSLALFLSMAGTAIAATGQRNCPSLPPRIKWLPSTSPGTATRG